MKTWKYITVLTVTAAVFAARSATAQDSTTTTTTVQTEPPPTVVVSNYAEPFYRDHEFSIDGFGSLSLGEQFIDNISATKVRKNGRLGGGAGVNLFFNKMVGIGADAWSEDLHNHAVDDVSGALIVRFPLADSGVAPYVFGGGGYQFDPVPQGFGQFGGGIEFRFNPHAGIFIDARYLVTRKSEDFGLARLGLRFGF